MGSVGFLVLDRLLTVAYYINRGTRLQQVNKRSSRLPEIAIALALSGQAPRRSDRHSARHPANHGKQKASENPNSFLRLESCDQQRADSVQKYAGAHLEAPAKL